MVKMLSTASVPVKNKLSFWSEAISETFVSLECSASNRDFIDGDISVHSLFPLELSRVRGTEQKVVRAASNISSRPSEDCYLVGIQTRGSCTVTQDGKTARIEHGGFALYDSMRPYTLELTDDFEQLVVRLPREALTRYLPDAQNLTAVEIEANRGAGALLVGTIRSLANDADLLAPETIYSVAQGVEHLIVAGLSTASKVIPDSSSVRRRSLIEHHISANLGDPELDIPAISVALHLSPSSLHRAFASDGETVMNWMWQQRLNGVYRDLTEGRYPGTLTELARKWGFSDSSHFSRAFRRRFGTTPSQLRATVV